MKKNSFLYEQAFDLITSRKYIGVDTFAQARMIGELLRLNIKDIAEAILYEHKEREQRLKYNKDGDCICDSCKYARFLLDLPFSTFAEKGVNDENL